MYTARIEAAEEIQLLLPDDQPVRELDGRTVMLVGLGLLLITFPLYGFRLFAGADPAD